MKQAFVILAASIVLLSSMSNLLLYAGFKFNQAEIERLYCVNKRKPKLNCHGKCHLKRQLAANNQTDNKPSPQNSLEEAFKLNLFCQPMPLLANALAVDFKATACTPYPLLVSQIFGDSPFQPPDHPYLPC